MSRPSSRLTRLQTEVLGAFFSHEQVRPEKPAHGIVRVDPAEEIFANKLCTLLGRSEIRDLVDARALEGLGLSLTDALAAGQRKDGGLRRARR